MNYISTRGGMQPIGFLDAVMEGLAPDGGLLLPDALPDVRDHLPDWRGLGYTELAFELMHLFATDLPEADLRELIRKSYATFRTPGVAPVVEIDDLFLLELWHGPTLAFKDVALQFLGNVFEYVLTKREGELNILGATSGDTGSAAIYGVRGKERIRIFVMHPEGRTSPVQEKQMTAVLDENVCNLAVEGTFDDCQRIMKAIFSDTVFKAEHALGSVNSVNWARVLAQIVYYFYATFRVQERTGAERVRFAVPTGNFGDIFAGFLAARMGLPIDRLLLATNENNILSRFFNTGQYRLGEVVPTLSPSMDIQVASNFERYLFYRLGEDPQALCLIMDQFAREGSLRVASQADGKIDPLFDAGEGHTEETLSTIRSVYGRTGYILDPHTAVGVAVARAKPCGDGPTICLATAHPAKFPEAIERAIGRVAHHPVLDALEGAPTRCQTVPNDEAVIRGIISQSA